MLKIWFELFCAVSHRLVVFVCKFVGSHWKNTLSNSKTSGGLKPLTGTRKLCIAQGGRKTSDAVSSYWRQDFLYLTVFKLWYKTCQWSTLLLKPLSLKRLYAPGFVIDLKQINYQSTMGWNNGRMQFLVT